MSEVNWNARIDACTAAMDRIERRMDAIESRADDFSEADHPRDENGMFGSGGGASGGGQSSPEAKAAQERIRARKQKMQERRSK